MVVLPAVQLLRLQATAEPGLFEHQHKVEGVTVKLERMSGSTSFCAAVWIPEVSKAVPRFWPPYWAPARAALETSIARKAHLPKSNVANKIRNSTGDRSTTSMVLEPASGPSGRKRPFGRRRLKRDIIVTSTRISRLFG